MLTGSKRKNRLTRQSGRVHPAVRRAAGRPTFERMEGRTLFSVPATAANVPVLHSDPAAAVLVSLDVRGAPAARRGKA